MNKQITRRLVLGEGETIGHKHVLAAKTDLEYTRHSECIRMVLKSVGILTHDEHDRMVLPVGTHRSYHQVEYNPMDETVNRIFD